MEISIIRSLDGLTALQSWWNSLHELDQTAGYFLSYDWMTKVLVAHPGEWLVMVAVHEQSPVCILPLRATTRKSVSLDRELRVLSAAGRLGWSQYSGFVCHPDFENEAVAALAHYINQQPWDEMQLKHFPADERLSHFCRNLDQSSMSARNMPDTINNNTVDNLVCPSIALPDDFEEWVNGRSANRRKKIRRAVRDLEEGGDLRVEHSTPETVSGHLDILFDHWFKQWAPQRGEEQAKLGVEYYRHVLRFSEELGTLDVPVLWRGETPLIALANIVDHDEKRVFVIATGRNVDVSEQNIGTTIHVDAIHRAIESNMKIYDFCHGDEAYKFDLGAEESRVSNLFVRRHAVAKKPPPTRVTKISQTRVRQLEPTI